MKRREYKFLIHKEKLTAFRKAIAPYLQLDKYSARKSDHRYTVRSIYYDTRQLEFYREKIEGIKIRKKIRVRGYDGRDDHQYLFLEIKRKENDRIFKNRSRVQFNKSDSLKDLVERTHSKQDEKNEEDAARFFYNVARYNLHPTVLVTYDREAYFCRYRSGLRLTIDQELRSKPMPAFADLFDESSLNYVMPNHAILEIKFYRGLPSWLQKVITQFNLSRQAISKYTTCLDYARHHQQMIR